MIISESEDYLIVNKPPYLSTLEDRANGLNLLGLARMYCPDIKVGHRLDKETSGVIVMPKHLDYYKYFSQELEQRNVVKMYHCIVEGHPDFNQTEIDRPILVTSNKSRVDNSKGKPSLTLVSTIEKYAKHSLIACMPFTGRTHQIRVHLKSVGFPIVGDLKYDGPPIFLSKIKRQFKISKNEIEKPLIARFALHAAKISFNSSEGNNLKFEAKYPKDFSVLLKQLEKNT